MLDRNIVNRNASNRALPLEQFFESFWGAPTWARKAESTSVVNFTPSCEVEETSKEYLFNFEVPGMKEDELNVEIKNQMLIVSGERKKAEERSEKTFHYSERSYGRFERSFTLPEDVDLSKIEAKHDRGILTVVATKKEVTAPMKIPITVRN
jgi:HSP20 family protein